MSDIFLSYASADRPRVKPLVDALRQQGWSVWWDRTILPGKTWDQVIEAALADTRCVIVLWSKDSVQSDWVRTEADEAKRRGILVPALLDNVTIPLAFRRVQAANLVDWSSTAPGTGFDDLVRAVSDVLVTMAPPASEGKAAAAAAAAASASPPVASAAPSPAQEQLRAENIPQRTGPEHRAVPAPEGAYRADRAYVGREVKGQEKPVAEGTVEIAQPQPAPAMVWGTFRKPVILFGLPAIAVFGLLIYALIPKRQAAYQPASPAPSRSVSSSLTAVAPPSGGGAAAKKTDRKPLVRGNEAQESARQEVPKASVRETIEPDRSTSAARAALPVTKLRHPIPAQRVRVGGNVQRGKLIREVNPIYPPLARQGRIQGTVVLSAIIGADGAVASLKVVSGHPLLISAAMDAVKQWVYSPTLMSGQPVEVETVIDVNFTLTR